MPHFQFALLDAVKPLRSIDAYTSKVSLICARKAFSADCVVPQFVCVLMCFTKELRIASAAQKQKILLHIQWIGLICLECEWAEICLEKQQFYSLI